MAWYSYSVYTDTEIPVVIPDDVEEIVIPYIDMGVEDNTLVETLIRIADHIYQTRRPVLITIQLYQNRFRRVVQTIVTTHPRLPIEGGGVAIPALSTDRDIDPQYLMSPLLLHLQGLLRRPRRSYISKK